MMEIKNDLTELEWISYFDLRYDVLRKPLQQEKGSEKDSGDSLNRHYALFLENKIVAIGRLDFLQDADSNIAQARFVAVDPNLQGKGLGKRIMNAMERDAKEANKSKMVLHARDYAIQFYENLGYSILEKSHLLFGILQHFKMEKEL